MLTVSPVDIELRSAIFAVAPVATSAIHIESALSEGISQLPCASLSKPPSGPEVAPICAGFGFAHETNPMCFESADHLRWPRILPVMLTSLTGWPALSTIVMLAPNCLLYTSFSLSDCALCKECAGFHGKPCANVKRARPAFHSVGIDVFKTVRKFGLPIQTLKDENDQVNWYSAVFVE